MRRRPVTATGNCFSPLMPEVGSVFATASSISGEKQLPVAVEVMTPTFSGQPTFTLRTTRLARSGWVPSMPLSTTATPMPVPSITCPLPSR